MYRTGVESNKSKLPPSRAAGFPIRRFGCKDRRPRTLTCPKCLNGYTLRLISAAEGSK